MSVYIYANIYHDNFQAETKMRGLLGKVGRVLSESKQSSFLGKLKRFSVRNLKCAGFWKNRVRIGQKIQCADFKANSGGFRSENKMFRFLEQTHASFGQKFEYADFWAKSGDFFGEIYAKSGIWMKCLYHSHDVRTICFFQAPRPSVNPKKRCYLITPVLILGFVGLATCKQDLLLKNWC